jgi:hypothetical protein
MHNFSGFKNETKRNGTKRSLKDHFTEKGNLAETFLPKGFYTGKIWKWI